MPRTPQPPTGAIATLIAQAKADMKKTVILSGLVVVLLVMVGRLVVAGGGPSKASASETPSGTQAPAQPTNPLLADPLSARAAEREDHRQRRRDEYLEQLGRNVTRDLFALDVTAYPPVRSQTPAPPRPEIDPAELQAERQAQAERARLMAERAHRELIHSRAQALRLQSILPGRNPTAIINNQVVGVGEQVSGFVVRQITGTECVIAQEGVELTLRMEQ